MPITLTSTGKIFHFDLTVAAKPDGITEVKGGATTITWQEGTGVAITGQAGAGAQVYLVSDTKLPDDKIFVMRSRSKLNSNPGPDTLMTYWDGAAKPSGDNAATRKARFEWYVTTNIYCWHPNGTEPQLGTGAVGDWQIFEFNSDGTTLTENLRVDGTLAVEGTAGYNWGTAQVPARADSLWAILGNDSSSVWDADITATYFQAVTTTLITITGLAAGNHVDVTDAADTVKAHATSAGASVTVDITSLEYPYNGKIKVYDSDGGALIDTLVSSTIYGGDEYALAAAAVLKGPRLVSAKGIYNKLGDDAGTYKFVIQDSADAEVATIDSNGAGSFVGLDAGSEKITSVDDPTTDQDAATKKYVDDNFAPAAEGVTNGDTHDHAGGDGAQIDHGGLGGLADDDHTQYTLKATLTEQGDIYYASAASTPAALPHGTAGQVLATGGHGANPSWVDAGTPAAHKASHEDGGADEISLAGLDYAVPAGAIIMWSGSIATIPTGWVLCDGNNSTPDLRDRFIIGAKQDDSGTAKTNVTGSLTQTGGAATHQLTEAELAAHGHGISLTSAGQSQTHAHAMNVRTGTTDGTYAKSATIGSSAGNPSTGNASQDHTHTVTGDTADTGSDTAHNNLPPYYALAFIMKT